MKLVPLRKPIEPALDTWPFVGAIERFAGGACNQVGKAQMAVAGKQLELSVARSLLMPKTTDLNFDFKWDDNAASDKLDEWFVYGDLAPNRRFSYRFLTSAQPQPQP